MLFALPGYQFPYIVMNRCLYLSEIHTPTRQAGGDTNNIWPNLATEATNFS